MLTTSEDGLTATPVHGFVMQLWIDAIVDELAKATDKFPTWPDDPVHAASVVFEEAGELQKATLEHMYEPHKSDLLDVRDEAIQTAAMALRFLISLHRYQFTPCKQHSQQDSEVSA